MKQRDHKTGGFRLQPGDRLGKYRLVRPLGRGGSGEVWLADNTFAFPGEQDRVALKVPREQTLNQVQLLAEPRMLVKLAHPNIVPVYAAERSNGIFFVVMEYMSGGPFRRLLRPRRPVPAKQVVRIARQVLSGLAHAHAARVIHRDVKPENILFDAEGIARIADFGTAREVTEAGHVVGTGGSRAYKAPEQFQGIATPASDVWGLGLTLYEAAAGRYPFLPTGTESLEEAIARRPVPPLAPRTPLGHVVAQLLDRCLQRAPESRFPDAGAMLTRLEEQLCTVPDGGEPG